MTRTYTLLVFLLGSLFSFAQSSVDVTLKWKFLNVIDGYDHLNKMEIYVDGNLISASPEFYETTLAEHTFKVPTGKHKVEFKNFAYYDGEWEAHTLDNDYSVEGIYSETRNFSKPDVVVITWDIDESSDTPPVVKWGKAGKKYAKKVGGGADTKTKTKPAKGNSLSVTWKFTNVNEGYDHDARLVIYADGEKICTSPVATSSKGGTFSCSVPSGTKELLVMTEAYYQGKWEEHTRVNEYSVDAFVKKTLSSNPSKLNVVFDIDSEEVTAKWQ